MSSVAATIQQVFEERGENQYGSEAVSQLEHALQCGTLAEKAGASRSLVVAAFVHDIGHILDDAPMIEDSEENLDDKHEYRGNAWLREHFGSEVADPVRLHVIAKRYLCTVDPEYIKSLSPTSLKSFHDQGGVMDEGERQRFEEEPYLKEALALRRWDDAAKIPKHPTPSLQHFLDLVREAVRKC